ncbi:hypothetical protein LTR42_011011 [Elasticomyces elasticus]|nr:hypothetical protein LTR42_011011 [Elasticomyces elasticus]
MAQQVIYLPELLENILLRLPMKDLLFSQKALFFTTNTNTSDSIAIPAAKAHEYSGTRCWCFTCTYSISQVKLNPLIVRSTTRTGQDSAIEGLGDLLYHKLHPQASCRRMLLAESNPAREMEVDFDIGADSDTDLDQLRSGWRVRESVSVYDNYSRERDEEVMRAKFKAGKAFGETKQRYEEAVEELRGEGLIPCNAGWCVSHHA